MWCVPLHISSSSSLSLPHLHRPTQAYYSSSGLDQAQNTLGIRDHLFWRLLQSSPKVIPKLLQTCRCKKPTSLWPALPSSLPTLYDPDLQTRERKSTFRLELSLN
jgi:hypothetical protein